MDMVIGFTVGVLIGVWFLMAAIIARYISKSREYKSAIGVADNDYCVCGDLVSSHTFSSGHAPLGQLDYFIETTRKPEYE